MSNRLLARKPGTRYAPATIYELLETTSGETITTTGGDPIFVMTSEKDGGRAWILQAKRVTDGMHANEFDNSLEAKQINSKLVADEWQKQL